MRKSLLLIAAFAPLAVVAGLALPVAAQAPDAGPSVAEPVAASDLDLSAIPVKAVTGQLAVKGVGGDDEDDDGLALRKGFGDAGRGESGGADDEAFGEDGE